MNTNEDKKEKFYLLIEGYQVKNIYNCDETRLFYHALPTKPLSRKRGSECYRDKNSKECVTVLLYVNLDGSLEMLLVVGKSKKS